jgi:hypothetical protein
VTDRDPCAHCGSPHVQCDANLDLDRTPCCVRCTHDHTGEHERTNPEHHDYDDPTGHLNKIEAALLGVHPDAPTCPHCATGYELIPMPGNGWALDTIHEPGCPDHDDNLPTPDRP